MPVPYLVITHSIATLLMFASMSIVQIESSCYCVAWYVVGLRKVYPYYFTFTTFTKGRWVGEKILDVFAREFRAHPAEEYVSISLVLLTCFIKLYWDQTTWWLICIIIKYILIVCSKVFEYLWAQLQNNDDLICNKFYIWS